jgi:ATP-dependent 26S proteasome regulatory subunit
MHYASRGAAEERGGAGEKGDAVQLITHLHVRTPVVWVTTDEAVRVIDVVVANSPRPVFRMDAIDGFCRWENDHWDRVLIEGNGGAPAPTRDLNEALPVVAEEGGTIIIEHAHMLPLEQLISAFVERFRRAVLGDNAKDIPPQLILCSYKDEVKPEVDRLVSKLDTIYPTIEELTKLTIAIASSAGVSVDEDVAIRAGRAASGLSESEAMATAMSCLAERGTINVEYMSRAKLDSLKAGGLLEVRTPTVSLKEVGGMDRAKHLIDAVAWMWAHPMEVEKFELVPPRRLLMVGLPGGGKSLMAEACAASLGLDLAKGGVSNAMTKWVGESERNMRRVFKQVKAMAPIVFWVDEFGRDTSGGQSSAEVDGGTTDRVHGEFLTGLQELPEDVLLVAAANRIDHLPPEMTRADRFDKIMFIGFPTEEERQQIFRIHLGKQHENFNLEELAKITPFFTGAEIKALVRDVRFTVASDEKRAANTDDLVLAAPLMKGRTWIRHHDQILSMYRRAVEEWEWASSKQEAEAQDVITILSPKKKQFVPPTHVPNFDG